MTEIQVSSDVTASCTGKGQCRKPGDLSDAGDQVAVAVITDDPIAGDSVRLYLRTAAGIRLLPREQAEGADVVVVVTVTPSDELMATLREVHQAAVKPRQCMVLISGPLSDHHQAQAFSYGVAAIVPRRSATSESIVHAVRASGHRSAVPSGAASRWLPENPGDFEQVATSAHTIVAGGLTVREVDVVRLLAEGVSTAEIARQLNYAERTIKNVIAEMLSRLRLRNRTQAVAYAYRVGAI